MFDESSAPLMGGSNRPRLGLSHHAVKQLVKTILLGAMFIFLGYAVAGLRDSEKTLSEHINSISLPNEIHVGSWTIAQNGAGSKAEVVPSHSSAFSYLPPAATSEPAEKASSEPSLHSDVAALPPTETSAEEPSPVASATASPVGDTDLIGTIDKVTEPEATRVSEIGKVTMIFGDNGVYERALTTHEAHNLEHGYPMFVLRRNILEHVWTKPAYILDLVLQELTKPEEERLKWLLWFDADTVIMNPKVPLELFLPPEEFPEINMLCTDDFNGLNNGVFFIRVHPWAVEVLSAVVSFTTFRPDVWLTFQDQSALDEVIKEPRFRKNVVKYPQRWFNAYQGEGDGTVAFSHNPDALNHGDFLVHFAGVGDREDRMNFWLDRAELHDPEWEVDIKYTTYPREIREFWGWKGGQIAEQKQMHEETVHHGQQLVDETKEKMEKYGEKLDDPERDFVRETWEALERIMYRGWDEIGAIEAAMERLREVAAEKFGEQQAASEGQETIAHRLLIDATSMLDNAKAVLPEDDEAFSELADKINMIRQAIERGVDHIEPTIFDKITANVEEAINHMRDRLKNVSPPEVSEHAPEHESEAEQPPQDSGDAQEEVDSNPAAPAEPEPWSYGGSG